MKRLPLIFILLVLLCQAVIVSSCGDDDNDYNTYEAWGLPNDEWYQRQKDSVVNGDTFYTCLKPDWYPTCGVLIHYFNNRKLTEGNYSPLANSTVKVIYRGAFYNGTGFDSSYLETDSCRTFTLGKDLIMGWRIALNDMRVGDSADIIVPWVCGYGYNGSSGIPGFSNLKFAIKLVDIPDYETRE